MPSEAKENRVEDAIAVELAKIGVQGGAGAWLTTPTFAVVGALPDKVADQTNPTLWLQYVRSMPLDQQGGISTAGAGHYIRAFWNVLCVSTDQTSPSAGWRKVKNLKADVLRALFAGESAVQTAGATALAWPGPFEMRSDLSFAGEAIGVLEVFADIAIDHADP